MMRNFRLLITFTCHFLAICPSSILTKADNGAQKQMDYSDAQPRPNGTIAPAVFSSRQTISDASTNRNRTKMATTASHPPKLVAITTTPTDVDFSRGDLAMMPSATLLAASSLSTTISSQNSNATKVFLPATVPSKACNAIIYRIPNEPSGVTINFPSTFVGIASTAVCPNNPRKLAIWRCNINGWSSEPGQPDLTDCVSVEIAALVERMNSNRKEMTARGLFREDETVDNVDNNVLEAENITTKRQTFYYAADLRYMTSIVSQLANDIGDLDENDDHKLANTIHVLNISSKLLADNMHDVWSSMPKEDRGPTLGKLFRATEQLSFGTSAVKGRKATFGLRPDDQQSMTIGQPEQTVVTNNFEVNVGPVERNARLKFSVSGKRSSSSSLVSSGSRQRMNQRPNEAKGETVSIEFSASLMQRMKRKPAWTSVVVYDSSFSEGLENLNISGVDGNKTAFNSPIFSLGFADEEGSWMENVLLPDYFQFEAEHRYSDSYAFETICSYYDVDYSAWLQRGCQQISKNKTHTVCACDHLTPFAILIDFRLPSDVNNPGGNATELPAAEEQALFNITIIGCALSIVALLVFVLLVAIISRQNVTLRVIYCNFAACLLIAELIFLAGADKAKTPGCVPVAVLMQFFFTATFMWSGAIAFYFILVIYGAEPLTSRERRPRWPYFLFGCYFISAALIASTWITAAVSDERAYGNDNYCWMNLPYTWFFISPVAFILLFNFCVLSAISVTMCSSRRSSPYVVQGSDESSVTVACRAMVGIIWTMLILCGTWVLGFFYVSTDSRVVEFVFVVLNSFQGVMVLVFYITTNRQIRLDFAMFCRRQSWLPEAVRSWASYKISSLGSHESWQCQDARKSNASSQQNQNYRELSHLSNSC